MVPTAALRPVNSFLLLGVLALTVFPHVGNEFYVDLCVHLMVMGIFAMSLDLLIGYTGLVSFGHAAFFGLSGYILALTTPDTGTVPIWVALPICLTGVALAALVIGWFSVRTSGIYFIMITLAFAQMLYYFVNDSAALGGSDGLFIFSKPFVGLGDLEILDLADPLTVYYLALASLAGCYLLLNTMIKAPFGQVIQAIRINEHRARALGYDTRRYKLAAFVIAGVLAGYAGFLEAVTTGIVSPGYLHWHQSGLVMMLVILGGMGTLYGAVLGAFVMGLLHDQVQELTEHWHLVEGIFVVAVVLVLPHGISGLLARYGANHNDPADPEEKKNGS